MQVDLEHTHISTMALTGHGKNRAYLHRFHLLEDAVCPCGNPEQTWIHIIYNCPLFEANRLPLIRHIILSGEVGWPLNESQLISGFTDKFLSFLNSIDLAKL